MAASIVFIHCHPLYAPGAVYQQTAQITIAVFMDTQQPWLTPTGMLFGREPQEGRKLSAVLEVIGSVGSEVGQGAGSIERKT